MTERDKRKRVLFVGEHPIGGTGNSKMLRALLSNIDEEKYEPACFVVDVGLIDFSKTLFNPLPIGIFISRPNNPIWNGEELLRAINLSDIDFLIMVGIDIWRYCNVYPRIKELARERKFTFIHIFPYDLQNVRLDWVDWINQIDVPCVYSRYGYEMLENYVPNLRYFRPSFQKPDMWKPLDPEKVERLRRNSFPSVPEDGFIYGFVGQNQVRKDIPGLLKAFSIVRNNIENVYLYMHTTKEGEYNIVQMAEDFGIHKGELLLKADNVSFYADQMPLLYNCFDCLVNCTMQEGLSWTVIEAMLCGIPIIASDSTAHTELVEGAGILVRCEERSYIVSIGKRGWTHIDAKTCDPEDVANAMVRIATDEGLNNLMKIQSRDFGEDWLEECSDINELLESVSEIKAIEIKKEILPAILFAQKSSGGDVLMTTRCFQGLKERHPNMQLHYMTSEQYIDIVYGCPYLDKIFPWDESLKNEYEYVYDPHRDRILPGHWGRNANSILADFYWKILYLDEPGDFYVHIESDDYLEEFVKNKNYCIVHTTGGDPEFRTYKYMQDVCNGLNERGYTTVQLGGPNDFPAGANYDLRGLSYGKSAFVTKFARAAITVDSFHSHLSGALGTSQVVLFGSGNAAVCRPKQVSGQLICMSPDYIKDCQGLGPCSASVRDCVAKCTGRHNPKDILFNIDRILQKESLNNIFHEGGIVRKGLGLVLDEKLTILGN